MFARTFEMTVSELLVGLEQRAEKLSRRTREGGKPAITGPA
jgi:hypothetical protein